VERIIVRNSNVDNTQESPTLISLCTGYGGLERGISSVIGEIRTLVNVEIEAYPIENLARKIEQDDMAETLIYTDVKSFPGKLFRDRVDIITGGYPCQPFSMAGERRGFDDPRHLWPYIRTIVSDVVPAVCFFENVQGHISLGLHEVLKDLEAIGYVTTFGVFSAAEVGATHERKRVFILANHMYKRLPGRWGHEVLPETGFAEYIGNAASFPNFRGSRPRDWEDTRIQPRLAGDFHGYPNRYDRIRMLGNGVIPKQAEVAFRNMMYELHQKLPRLETL
jgi:site-specific DNA-cytosine methylase